ncbi:MAG TPA: hypothetical protein VNZ53_52470 [Steroidobacteraceae bacterium]|nr:hypothetical protein [Steroidobacteraceae bacterium]
MPKHDLVSRSIQIDHRLDLSLSFRSSEATLHQHPGGHYAPVDGAVMAYQLQLFDNLPRVRGPNIKWLTRQQVNLMSWVMMRGNDMPLLNASSKRVLRRLICDNLVEVEAVGPSRYRVTEFGLAVKRSARVRE